jgi:peptidyl-prolyl cis-trans isomerase C
MAYARISTVLLWCLFSAMFAAAAVFADEAGGASHDPARIIAFQGDVTLSHEELDAAFSKLPEAERLMFIRDGARVDRLIRSLLQRKVIAEDARKAGYDKEVIVAARLELQKEKELAEAWLQHVVDEAPAADYEALAYEHYLANPDAYRSEVVLDVSHILLGTEERSVADALKLAESVREQLAEDPSRFEELVEEYSDDPAKVNNQGRYMDMRRGMMVAPFEKAAYALSEDGEISKPVKTDFGYHIIRLNGRSGGEPREFEEVKAQAVAAAERRYIDQYRDNYLSKMLAEPVGIPEGAVEIMAKRHFGEDLELAPGPKP